MWPGAENTRDRPDCAQRRVNNRLIHSYTLTLNTSCTSLIVQIVTIINAVITALWLRNKVPPPRRHWNHDHRPVCQFGVTACASTLSFMSFFLYSLATCSTVPLSLCHTPPSPQPYLHPSLVQTPWRVGNWICCHLHWLAGLVCLLSLVMKTSVWQGPWERISCCPGDH